jgi:hypothetical protein
MSSEHLPEIAAALKVDGILTTIYGQNFQHKLMLLEENLNNLTRMERLMTLVSKAYKQLKVISNKTHFQIYNTCKSMR